MRKHLVVLIILQALFVNPVFAKRDIITDTVYYNHDWEKVNKDSAYYYEIPTVKIAKSKYKYITNYASNGLAYKTSKCKGHECWEVKYYESGYKECEGMNKKGLEEGLWKWYFDSTEKLSYTVVYKKGFYNGDWIAYYKNGQVKCKSFEKQFNVLRRKCYTEQGNDTTDIPYRDIPHFPYGDDKFESYVLNDTGFIRFTESNKKHGRVYVYACFDETGYVYKCYVSESLSAEADAEALRLVKNMPKWLPALDENGMPIKMSRTLDIIF